MEDISAGDEPVRSRPRPRHPGLGATIALILIVVAGAFISLALWSAHRAPVVPMRVQVSNCVNSLSPMC